MAESPKTSIREIFAEVPATYEIANHLLTLGLDFVWRRRAVREAGSVLGTRWLDVCTGTGETAAHLARRAGGGATVIAADFSLPMLRQAIRKSSCGRVSFVAGAAGELPFSAGSFDAITMTFAARNLNVTREALLAGFREFHRVLKPGGTIVNLETSQPPARLIRSLRDAYVRAVVPSLGALVSGSRAGYSYLSRTIRRFYTPEELSSIIWEAGFSEVRFRLMTWGVVAVHRAVK